MSSPLLITYVVAHRWPLPRVSLKTKILDGDILVVAAGDLAERADEAEKLLAECRDSVADDQLKYSIDEFLN